MPASKSTYKTPTINLLSRSTAPANVTADKSTTTTMQNTNEGLRAQNKTNQDDTNKQPSYT